jgi:hypothetical protein
MRKPVFLSTVEHTENLVHLGVMMLHKLGALLQGTSDEKSKVFCVLYLTLPHDDLSESEGISSIVYQCAGGGGGGGK